MSRGGSLPYKRMADCSKSAIAACALTLWGERKMVCIQDMVKIMLLAGALALAGCGGSSRDATKVPPVR